MAFAGAEDVIGVIERLVKGIWNGVIPNSVEKDRAFMRITYQDAMLKVNSHSFANASMEVTSLTCGTTWR
jgi:aspartyl-tRNA synthetase